MRALLAASVAALALSAAGAASAATVNFQGYTSGCFEVNCAPETVSGTGPDLYQGLTFNSTTFNENSSSSGALNNLILGSFSLAGLGTENNFTPKKDEFTLRVTFTAPPGTTPGSQLFTADVKGNINQNDKGTLDIDFNNLPFMFQYSGGTFSFSVADIAGLAISSQPTSLFGNIQATAVPGPIAGAGIPALFAAGGWAWARRRKAQASAS